MRTANHLQREAAQRLGEAILNFILAMVPEKPEMPPMTHVVPPKPEMKSNPQPLLISMQAAAKSLGISDRTLWKLSQPRGRIPVVRVGKRVCYSVSALQEWIASGGCANE